MMKDHEFGSIGPVAYRNADWRAWASHAQDIVMIARLFLTVRAVE
jgi:hypothetical protein